MADIAMRVATGDLSGPSWAEAQRLACKMLGFWAWAEDPETIELAQLAAEGMVRAANVFWVTDLLVWAQDNIIPYLDEERREEFSAYAENLPTDCLEGRGVLAEETLTMWADIAGTELPRPY